MVRRPSKPDETTVAAATIRDVAQRAGVAVSTVSRALANEPRVADATRHRIFAIAHELGYSPNHFARSMRSANTRTIGFVAPDLENPISTDHLRAAINAADAAGYTLLVADGQGSREIQEAQLARLREYRVDGLLLGRGVLPVSESLIEFVRRGVPVEPSPWTLHTLRAARGELITGYEERGKLERSAAVLAYRALIAAGNRRIIYVTRRLPRSDLANYRLQTLHEVAADATTEVTFTVVGTTQQDAIGTIQDLAVQMTAPIGIVCANGLLTPHVLEGIRSAALRIPEDVSFVCYGDSAWHRAYAPPLSVIRHDYALEAQRSVERLVARIEGGEVPDTPPGPSEFVDRGSIRRA